MSIRKCPKCGLPIANLSICPGCGYRGEPVHENKPTNGQVTVKKVNNLRMTPWEIAFIFLCNISLVLTLVNVIVGGICWCQYPILGMFFIYFFAFSCASRGLRKFVTRYRNAVFIMNILAGLYCVIYNAMSDGNMNWALDYFVPVNLILACFVMLCLLFVPTVSIRNVLFSSAILLIQSGVQFILFACGVTGHSGRVSEILIICAFSVNLITAINFNIIYMLKAKNLVLDTFKWWE